MLFRFAIARWRSGHRKVIGPRRHLEVVAGPFFEALETHRSGHGSGIGDRTWKDPSSEFMVRGQNINHEHSSSAYWR